MSRKSLSWFPHSAGRRWNRWLKVGVVLIALAALVLLGRRVQDLVPGFAEWIGRLGVWAPLLFIVGYVVATVAFVPGSLLTLIAGAIFGLARGTLYVFAGATIGSVAAFLIARYLARSRIEAMLAKSGRFSSIDHAVGERGFRIVLLLRLSPLFPFNLLNYALGLTRVSLQSYTLAAVGMLPGTFLYVYYGKVVGDLASLASGMQHPRGAGYWLVLGGGLLATVAVTAIVTTIARDALKEYEQQEESRRPDAFG